MHTALTRTFECYFQLLSVFVSFPSDVYCNAVVCMLLARANNIVFTMFDLKCTASENHFKAPKNDKCMCVLISNESHTKQHTSIL